MQYVNMMVVGLLDVERAGIHGCHVAVVTATFRVYQLSHHSAAANSSQQPLKWCGKWNVSSCGHSTQL